jgi:hypothetical protein
MPPTGRAGDKVTAPESSEHQELARKFIEAVAGEVGQKRLASPNPDQAQSVPAAALLTRT